VNHFIDAVLEPGLWRLADWSLRWALLIGLLAAGLRLLRPRRAATRSLACWLVLLGGLLLPMLPHWGPPLTLPQTSEEAPTPAGEALPLPEKMIAAPPVEPVAVPTPTLRSGGTPVAQPLGAKRLVILSVALLWGAGVVLLLVRLVGGWLLLTRLRRTAVLLDGAAAELLAACRTQLGLRRPVALAVHAAVGSPVTLGLFRSTVLVPPDWPGLEEPTRRGSLLHELAHLARGDDWTAVLFELVRTAFFFHPGVRWLLARLECERELLCDEAALAGGLDARSYARMLVDFSRRCGRLLPAPLAAPAYPLRIGGRRTVTVRIHHLLEENMKQWLSPTPRWQALTLAVLLFGLAAVLGGFRVGAGEPPAALPKGGDLAEDKKAADPAPPAKEEPAGPVKKEALRYGGKTFEQWRTELVTELKPEIRIDGIKALREFGANGYGPEATAAILQVMQGYDVTAGNQDDGNVVNAGLEAVPKIGKPAVPVLIGGLQGENRNGRRFAAAALGRLGADARPALPALIKAIRDEDPSIRHCAVLSVEGIQPDAPGLIEALIGLLKDKDWESLRSHAAQYLGLTPSRPQMSLAVPALVEALHDENAQVRFEALTSLGRLRPEAPKVVPALAKLLHDADNSMRIQSMSMLSDYGPAAREAVPALVALLKDSGLPGETRKQAVIALGVIGPDAKEAVPVLNQLLKDKDSREFEKTVINALNQINK
jgi:HEAT repeat protein/beta-lactamase regulating signal transducer with metallopeptidase domain